MSLGLLLSSLVFVSVVQEAPPDEAVAQDLGDQVEGQQVGEGEGDSTDAAQDAGAEGQGESGDAEGDATQDAAPAPERPKPARVVSGPGSESAATWTVMVSSTSSSTTSAPRR